MGRSPCCSKEGLNRGAWTAMEDKILTEYIKVHGEGKWRNLPKRAGLKRCGKSCRLRWLNYLRPDIKRGNITHDEEELIIRLHNLLGNRWSLIAGRLPGRTDNEIKNYWNTNIGKKIQSAATSNTTCRTKPAATQPNLRPPSPNKTSPSSAQQPSKGSPHSHVVRTKATRCTKVVLLPPQDPQKPHDHDHHDNGYKPAADEVPSAAVNDELVNDQTVADSAVALGDHEPLFPFVPDFDNHDESNNSQFMKFDHHHDLEIDEKFLSDFLNIDCLEMELSDCFPNGVQDYDIDGLINFFITSPCSSNNNNNDNSNNNVDLFSDQELLFGADDQLLQTGSTSNDHLIDANEIDWLQD